MHTLYEPDLVHQKSYLLTSGRDPLNSTVNVSLVLEEIPYYADGPGKAFALRPLLVEPADDAVLDGYIVSRDQTAPQRWRAISRRYR